VAGIFIAMLVLPYVLAFTVLFVTPAIDRATSKFDPASFPRVQTGMDSIAVIDQLGDPDHRSTVGLSPGEECWTYYAPGALVPDPMYLVWFKDGVVTRTEIDDY
jgi:hypothetical protein